MPESYHPLTIQQAAALACRLSPDFANPEQLECEEIGDGNLNLVFRIRDRMSGKSLIIKQALPYAKVVGESWPLTLDRARIEYDALQIQGGLCPGLTPKLYGHDSCMAYTAMEDLSDHHIMRQGLIQRRHYPKFAEDISDFLSRTLFYTSDLGMNQQEKKLQAGRFINPELCKITEDLIFDHPYADMDTNNFEPALRDIVEQIWRDAELQSQAAMLREGFLTRAQALLHGDLHTGSIFVTETSTKVIDPEFAFYGPMGFDIGAVIGNLLLNFASQEGWSEDDAARSAYREYLLQTVRELWLKFNGKFLALWEQKGADRMFRNEAYRKWYMQRLLRDTAGYAGCKAVRRIIGLAHVADIDTIEDGAAREKAQRIALALGTSLIKHHCSIGSIDDVLDTARTAAGMQQS